MANQFYHAAQEFKSNSKNKAVQDARRAKAKAKRKEGWQQMKRGAKKSLVDATIEGGKWIAKTATAGTLLKDASLGKVVNTGLTGAKDYIIGLGKVIFNHPEWYLHGGYQNLIAANFATKKGVPGRAQLEYVFDDDGTPNTFKAVSAPNVIAYNTFPNKPINDQGGWNLGVQRLYNMLRAANSGARNYTIKDLESYIITQRSMLIILHSVRRIIGTYNQFSYFDVQVPKQLLNAMGVTDTAAKAVPDLINAYNRACAWFSAKFPLKLTLHERDAWLYNNIFCDSDDIKSNYHLFVPRFSGLRYLDTEGNLEYFSSMFRFQGVPGQGASIADLATDLDNMSYTEYNGLFDVIAGDILKAWGTESIYNVEQIDNTYRTPVIYDEYALAQIQNMDILGEAIINTVNISDSDTVFNFAVTTPDSILGDETENFWDLQIKLLGATNQITLWPNLFKESILNSPTDTQDAGRILSYTRLKATLKVQGNNVYVASCGTEVVTMAYVFFTISDYDTDYDRAYSFKYLPMGRLNFPYVIVREPSTPTAENFDHKMFAAGIVRFAWSNVDYAPRISCGTVKYDQTSDLTQASITETLFDFNNYAIIDEELIKTYHGIADQSIVYTTVSAKLAGDYQELKF